MDFQDQDSLLSCSRMAPWLAAIKCIFHNWNLKRSMKINENTSSCCGGYFGQYSWKLNLLTTVHLMQLDNESFLWWNKIGSIFSFPFFFSSFFAKPWFCGSWLAETLNLAVTMNGWAVDMPELSKTSCPQRDQWPAISEQEGGKWNLGNREGC